ncbi:MAG: hypothetical protein U0269_20100 [Polyangiales bacterium]
MIDDDELARRVFRPERPRTREVRSAIEGLEDPQEAWETLATRGFLPADWLDDAARLFQAGPPVLEEPIGIVHADFDAGASVSVRLTDPNRRYRLANRSPFNRVFRAAEPLRAGDFVVQCGRFDVRPAAPAAWASHPPSIEAVIAFGSDIAAASAVELLAREHFGDQVRAVRWRALCEDELEGIRDDVRSLALSASLPRELRAALALGYFVRGIDREGAIEIVVPERVDE